VTTPPTPPASSPAAALPYGPNSQLVRRLLQRLSALPPAGWARAAATYAELQGDARLRRADRSLQGAVERTGRERARDAVVGPLVHLVAGLGQLPAAPGAPAVDVEKWSEVALAAALALVVRDAIDQRAFDALWAPWAELIPSASLEEPPAAETR
jgi:hypothetical protein